MKKYLLPVRNKVNEHESSKSKERYEAMGFKTRALHENGLLEVGLPAGLKIEFSKYSSESRHKLYILDSKSRIRAECYVDETNNWVDFKERYVPQVLSKASLKDSISETEQGESEQDEATQEESDAAIHAAHCGLVVDGHRLGEIKDEDVIYRTEFIDDRLGDKSYEIIVSWLDTNYPDWKNTDAYWHEK